MEANQKKKFVCKFCNKRFPCGKSLGGHIRIHLKRNSNGVDEDFKFVTSQSVAINTGCNRKKDSGPESGGQSTYVLRENPKKTKRFMVDSSNPNFLQEKVCKECGKVFQSLKALCGHMACHSKSSFDDHSDPSEKLKELVMDSQSDSETSTPSKQRRSASMRYKTVDVSSSLENVSFPSACDIEQEQEEVAICLMMLSRDSGFKGCFSLAADSSYNNSVVSGAKATASKMRIRIKNGFNCLYNDDDLLEAKKTKQREVISVQNDHIENPDCGYFRNGLKRVKSEENESKKCEVEFGSEFSEDLDPELGERLSRFKRIKAQSEKDLIEENGYDRADRVSMKHESKNDSYSLHFLSSNAQKTNGCIDSMYESRENSLEIDYSPRPSPQPTVGKMLPSCNRKDPVEHHPSNNADIKLGQKKAKTHECSFCFKVFQSGRALGGHKRSHFIRGAENRTLVINQEVPEESMPQLIDLNLPAPMEEEANGFISW